MSARQLAYELISPFELLVDVWRASMSSPFFRRCLHAHLTKYFYYWLAYSLIIVFDAILDFWNWREGLVANEHIAASSRQLTYSLFFRDFSSFFSTVYSIPRCVNVYHNIVGQYIYIFWSHLLFHVYFLLTELRTIMKLILPCRYFWNSLDPNIFLQTEGSLYNNFIQIIKLRKLKYENLPIVTELHILKHW